MKQKRIYICKVCACRDDFVSKQFYCSYWDKRCHEVDHRVSCPGFIHKDSFDNNKTIEEMLKDYDEEIKEEGEP